MTRIVGFETRLPEGLPFVSGFLGRIGKGLRDRSIHLGARMSELVEETPAQGNGGFRVHVVDGLKTIESWNYPVEDDTMLDTRVDIVHAEDGTPTIVSATRDHYASDKPHASYKTEVYPPVEGQPELSSVQVLVTIASALSAQTASHLAHH